MEKKIQIHIEFNNNINLNFKDFYSDFEYIVYFTKEIFDINKNIIIKLIQNNIGIIFSIDYNNINFLIENIDFINDNNICVYLNSYDIKHIERYIFDISRISKLVLVYNITGFENNLYRVLEQLNDILEKIKIYKKYYCDFIINDFEKNYNFIQKYISLFDTNKCSNTLFFNKILKRITYINEYEYLLPYNYVKMNYDNKKIIINNKEIDNNIILIKNIIKRNKEIIFDGKNCSQCCVRYICEKFLLKQCCDVEKSYNLYLNFILNVSKKLDNNI